MRINKSKGGREQAGLIEIKHKGRILKTSVGSTPYERAFCGLRGNIGRYNRVGKIPVGYDSRPDLIANLFFGSPSNWWILCEKNNYFDVFENINIGDRINIPKLR
jgi:hypothetical protein